MPDRYCLMHLKQASKVDVASVHYIKRPWLQNQDVQHIDLVHLAVADVNECGNRAPEVQQCVQLDGCLGFAKRRPLEQLRHRSMVVASNAETVFLRSSPKSSSK
jgi:hypothetical protein